MVDHMIVTWEGKYGNLFCQIRNKAKVGRSFGNTLKRKVRRSLGNGGSIFYYSIALRGSYGFKKKKIYFIIHDFLNTFKIYIIIKLAQLKFFTILDSFFWAGFGHDSIFFLSLDKLKWHFQFKFWPTWFWTENPFFCLN